MDRTIGIALLGVLLPAWAAAAEPAGLDKARQDWQIGKYAQALEAYDALAQQADANNAELRAEIALGRADCLASTGELDKAIETLRALADGPDPAADVLARLADMEFGRGRWDRAEALAQGALKAEPDHLLGHWVIARLLEARGETEKADAAYRWFIDYRNAHTRQTAEDAEALLLIGQAAERYARANARGEDLKDSLEDVINELYEGALRADPRCWQAPWLEGRLFLAG
jgi:cellulose synthase operon protein C